MVAGVELIYNTAASAMQMAQQIFGNGITVTGASYTGDSRASAIYSGGNGISPGVVPGDTGVILSTGQARAFTTANNSQSNVSTQTTTANNGPNNVTDFRNLAGGASTYDASYLDVSFVPDAGIDSISIKFVFASDEFPEFTNSIYNDLIGVWSNGQYVPVSVGNGNVSIGNINQVERTSLFVDNTGDQYNTEMDGFTLTLSLDIPVTPGQANTLRIGISDVADANYDSNLLIAADSIQGTLVASDDAQTITFGGTKTFDPLVNDINNTAGTMTITHINGVPVSAGNSVTLSTGQVVTLNADGTFTVTTDVDAEEINFTYTVTSSTGEDDVAIVQIETVPCFTRGTMILTPHGEVPVETLKAGDKVLTYDHGSCPITWTGVKTVEGHGRFAPIRIERGALGNYRTLVVSPQHRVLLSSARAELMFGSAEVLVPAKFLVNGHDILQTEVDEVDYIHFMFEHHQIVFSEGILTESLLPGEVALNAFDVDARDEMRNLFADDTEGAATGYGPAARRILRAYEARALLGEPLGASPPSPNSGIISTTSTAFSSSARSIRAASSAPIS